MPPVLRLNKAGGRSLLAIETAFALIIPSKQAVPDCQGGLLARFTSGYIKLYRSIEDGDIPQHGALTYLVWIRILKWANWKESQCLFDGDQITIRPGQLVTGLQELTYLDLDPYLHKVRRALSYLEKTQRIEQAISNQGRLITVINWGTYQGQEQDTASKAQTTPQTDRKQSANGPQLSEEVKKGRTKENIYTPLGGLPECIQAWGETLQRFGISKDPKFDEAGIARLIQMHGQEKTAMALRGAAKEAKSENFDPSKHVNIRRLLRTDIFEKFVNLGGQADEAVPNAGQRAVDELRRWKEEQERSGG